MRTDDARFSSKLSQRRISFSCPELLFMNSEKNLKENAYYYNWKLNHVFMFGNENSPAGNEYF